MATMEEFEESSQSAVTGMGERFENVLEIQESARSISQFSDSMSEAVQGANDLHQMSELISTECDCEAAMEIAQISVESVYKRLGISQRILPSLENYRDKVALEFIGKAVSSVWNAIKSAFIKLYDMIKGFFAWLFGGTSSVEKHNNRNETETQNIATNKPTIAIDVSKNIKEQNSQKTDSEVTDFLAEVNSGKQDASIQVSVQQTVLHDPNHSANPDTQKQVQEEIAEIKDQLKNGVQVTSKQDLDKTINSSDKPVMCDNKVYVPLNRMFVGHYINYLSCGLDEFQNTDPQDVINGLGRVIDLQTENIASFIELESIVDSIKDMGTISDIKESVRVFSKASIAIKKNNDHLKHTKDKYMGYFKIELKEHMAGDNRDYMVLIPSIEKYEPTVDELHEIGVTKIKIPSKQDIEKITEVNKKLSKLVKDMTKQQNKLDSIISKIQHILNDSINLESSYAKEKSIWIMEYLLKVIPFYAVHFNKYCFEITKAVTQYVGQANRIYKKKS